MGLDLRAGVLNVNPDRSFDEGEYEYLGTECPYMPQWSYSGFASFRRRVAAAEGVNLSRMRGFTNPTDGLAETDPNLPAHVPIEWDTVTSPLVPLLDHSDCDGEMTPEDAGKVWPRLSEIVEGWTPSDPFDYDVQAGRELVNLLRACAENGWAVLFR